MLNYKPFAILLSFAVLVLLFIYFAKKDKNKWSNVTTITYGMEIEPIIINRYNDRGSIYINKSLVINSRCLSINQPTGFKGWVSHGPIIDFNNKPHVYRLGDLEVPYLLSKKQNCDTIFVKKDEFKLMFLLVD